MTPLLHKDVADRRPKLDPEPGVVTLGDLTDDKHKQHCISDHALGMVYVAIHGGRLSKKKADMFETCFVRGVKIRKLHVPHGRPCLDPDGRALLLDDNTGRALTGGAENGNVLTSQYTVRTVSSHPRYKKWLGYLLHGKHFERVSVEDNARVEDDDSVEDNASDVADAGGSDSESGGDIPHADLQEFGFQYMNRPMARRLTNLLKPYL
ncbi:uncharacterized protein BP5553_05191 [Venustampulla echinocandica]|uniref:Uncharacterized protein n=1 Tax=Venustampulla echinocandica TaxID=2656787 RepID=A0A370TQG4_9HELO|nr:uncharacterized protein BP5553_05191 [Venustampulla echinocandica]RDL37758.1 hypothetical protein BP5553_05191 [Venustampulla echinocandica]